METRNIPMAGKSRALLHEYGYESEADLDDPYGIKVSIKPGPPWEIPPKTPAVQIPSSGHSQVVHKMDQSKDSGDKNIMSDRYGESDIAAEINANKLAEQNDTVLKFKETQTVKEEM